MVSGSAAVRLAVICCVAVLSCMHAHAFDGTIRIGAAATVTGTFAAQYVSQNVSWQMWLDYVNGAGGGLEAKGKRYAVEFIVEDVQDSLAGTAAATEKLITEHNCTIIFAPYGSTYTPAAAEIGDKYQVPVISGGSAAETVFTNITTGRRRFEYLVGLNSPAEEYFADFVDLMALQGAKTLVVLAEDAAFPSATAIGAVTSAEDRQITILKEITIPRVTTLDAASQAMLMDTMREIQALNPDILASAVYYSACEGLVRAARALDWLPKAWGLTVCIGSPALEEALGPDLNFLYGPSQWDHRLKGRNYDETGYTLVQHFNRDNASAPQAFWDEYYQRAGVYPTYQAAGAMAQGYSLEAALKVAHSMDSSSVMLALASLYEASFYGRISFGFNGMNNLKSMVVYQYRAIGGELAEDIHLASYRVEIVTPLSASTSPPVYPMPTWAERVYTRHFYDTWAERIVGVVTLLFMVATLVVAALFYAKRQSKIVKASNHLFCQLMFLGGLLLYSAILVWPSDASEFSCKAFPWLFLMGMSLFLACLVAKNYRICKIMSQRLRRVRISVRQLILIVAAIVAVELCLIMLWYLVGAPEPLLITPDPVRPSLNYHDCQTSTEDSSPVVLTIGVYSTSLGIAAVVIAFLSRAAPSEYNESRTIALATYNTALGGLLFGGLTASPVAEEPSLRSTWYALRSALALVVITGTLGAVFGPKLVWLLLEIRGVDIKSLDKARHGDSHNGVSRGGSSRSGAARKASTRAARHASARTRGASGAAKATRPGRGKVTGKAGANASGSASGSADGKANGKAGDPATTTVVHETMNPLQTV